MELFFIHFWYSLKYSRNIYCVHRYLLFLPSHNLKKVYLDSSNHSRYENIFQLFYRIVNSFDDFYSFR